MLSRSAALLSFAAVALAISTGDLTVKLSAVSSTVSSLDDIILTAVLSNPTSEDVKIVKFGSILDELPTDTFNVKKGGVALTFSGIDVSPDLSDEKAYVTIPAGGSRAVNHTVAASYDFETAGAGTFTFETYSRVNYVDAADGEIYPFEFESASVDVEVTQDVAKRHVFGEAPSLEKRQSTPVCSNPSRRAYLAAALSEARAVAGSGAAYVRSHPNSADFTTYFGNANRNTIWNNLDMIAGDLPSAGVRGLHCQDRPNGPCAGGGINAYVQLVTSGVRIISSEAYFCEHFFNKANVWSLCRGADFPDTYAQTMMHELAHGVFASRDHVYRCPGARALSNALKWENSDNYTCFSLHRWKNTNC